MAKVAACKAVLRGFDSHRRLQYYFMSNNSRNVIAYRKRQKQKVIEALGGKCVGCGYCKYNGALEYHHINPQEKDFTFGKFYSISWERIVAEATKCVLVCSNCHKEIHAGIRLLPEGVQRFDERLIKTKTPERKRSVSSTG